MVEAAGREKRGDLGRGISAQKAVDLEKGGAAAEKERGGVAGESGERRRAGFAAGAVEAGVSFLRNIRGEEKDGKRSPDGNKPGRGIERTRQVVSEKPQQLCLPAAGRLPAARRLPAAGRLPERRPR